MYGPPITGGDGLAGASPPRSLPVTVVAPIPVVTGTVIEVHARLPIVAIIAVVPVAIVRLLDGARLSGAAWARAERRRLRG